ncbi:hypothetical protein [Terribacillus saccharophilus]|uniref:hypothetical protein n=1 Tax=Terribacillus saccharophilus TaxID=361277 RepID=UPI002DC6A021|nr:hypothetical protein [Terribacillus saccharophilus]
MEWLSNGISELYGGWCSLGSSSKRSGENKMRWLMGLLILVVLITGCSNQEDIQNECLQEMTGYLEITEDKEYVIDETDEMRYLLNDATIPDTIENGEEITVTYKSILESYPPQLTVCEIK